MIIEMDGFRAKKSSGALEGFDNGLPRSTATFADFRFQDQLTKDNELYQQLATGQNKLLKELESLLRLQGPSKVDLLHKISWYEVERGCMVLRLAYEKGLMDGRIRKRSIQ